MTAVPHVAISAYEEAVEIGSLVPHPDNPNEGDPGAIAESILANGFVDPVLVQADGRRILAGHHTVIACRDILGMETVPVIWTDVDDLTGDRILVALNAAAAKAQVQPDRLLPILLRLSQADALLGSLYAEDDIAALRGLLSSVSGPIPDDTTPTGFPEFGADTPTAFKCPRCEYEWSGTST